MSKNFENNETLLQAKDVFKEYANGERTVPVLRGINLAIKKGEIVVIVGASGAGKSTLLHILGILDTPTSGSVFYKGINLTQLSEKKQADMRNRVFGFVFQFYHLLPDFTALENILLPSLIGSRFLRNETVTKNCRERAISLLERVGMRDRFTHKPSQLSGGERQRVAIIRALINNPELLLCDEPTGNLDTKTGHEIRELIWDVNKTMNQTVVIVTHDEEMAKNAGRVVRMVDGGIVE
ncbi:MAG: ABC transporter ATP-binding protein [Planctomycetia bacterium]|uniref:ABC transporter ATP-binding protein n=1 Tax=Candidatus Brocadia sapporoensis TaxID=392547 RepID=A0A1V6LY47_9BACT|nr:ABC transporter ATP-binding protein [Candidatus Brocadia sapporoensis]MCC7238005.1 ABC transporter ATP-binding protein [Candidatus Brocadia sp.]OQZ03561.1 MAG: ABC transporter ATP-binding protein [Candidatus Brocadia sp. UTAMX1]QOJ07957.1 MAG: ABC transporter ATP-binding protein [Planctomycetia bacterium]RZV58340.1 MAG: ABC transporter ATP-binding protein [Candidatus Brocadia sp. BROELEC01]TVL96258.1 MAG: ABC transporter ATP-binding protein [Candidatus Brocadia sp. BL1]